MRPSDHVLYHLRSAMVQAWYSQDPQFSCISSDLYQRTTYNSFLIWKKRK
jgi:hypothetical protein